MSKNCLIFNDGYKSVFEDFGWSGVLILSAKLLYLEPTASSGKALIFLHFCILNLTYPLITIQNGLFLWAKHTRAWLIRLILFQYFLLNNISFSYNYKNDMGAIIVKFLNKRI